MGLRAIGIGVVCFWERSNCHHKLSWAKGGHDLIGRNWNVDECVVKSCCLQRFLYLQCAEGVMPKVNATLVLMAACQAV